MNSSLHELQSDIQRLATQQHQMQDLTAQHRVQGLVSHQQQQHIQVCVIVCIFVHAFRLWGRLGLDFLPRQDIFFFSKACGPALGPTQPPVQCILGALSPGVKQLTHEAYHSSSSAKVKNEWSYTSASPVCLHGMYRASFTFVLYLKVAVDCKHIHLSR
jgi:hypothetical protein